MVCYLSALFLGSSKGSKIIVWPSLYNRYVAGLQGLKLETLDGSKITYLMPTDKADLSLPWAHRSFCWFCHETAHMKTKSLQQSIESVFFFFFFLTKLIQIKGLIWLYNISLWYTIAKLNSTAVCEDKRVLSQEFYHFVPAEN